MTEKCLECDKDADWIRHTQFAGNHPYCEEHARQESDFGDNDSYTYWTKARQPTPEVVIGRLVKKLNKMRDQRDKARKDLEYYAKVISLQPYLETRWKSYEERVAAQQRAKDMEARVKEQAELILQLQKEIARLTTMPAPFKWPDLPKYSMNTGCPVCGLGANGEPMGYVCPRTDCPSAVRCS